MPNDTAERAIPECEGIQMTPSQSNEIIEEGLAHLKPALENVYGEMVRLKEELANGKFSVKSIMRRVKRRLELA